MTGWGGVATVSLAALSVLLLPLLLRRLPEPVLAPDVPGPGYRQLARPSTVLLHGAVTVAGTAVVLALVPAASWPLWWPLLSVGLASAVVDARTTWIPRQLSWVGWGLLPVALLVQLGDGGSPVIAVGAALGALAATALFWLLWRLSRGSIGFGDVRLAPLLGLAAGATGLTGWWWSLLLGTTVGALAAVLRVVLRRPAPMAYAPALASGPFMAVLLASVLG